MISQVLVVAVPVKAKFSEMLSARSVPKSRYTEKYFRSMRNVESGLIDVIGFILYSTKTKNK